jgi:hypothetical protein
MSGLYHDGKNVNPKSLGEFLKKNNFNGNLIGHYVASFKKEKGEGETSKYDFRRWAERVKYKNYAGVSSDDAINIWNIINKA